MIPEPVYAHSLRELFLPVQALLADPSVSEIMINGPGLVFVERRGKVMRTDARFADEDALLAALRLLAQYAGRTLSEEQPILEARMPDGSRVEAVLAPIAKGGAHVSIRRFTESRLTLGALVAQGSLSQAGATLLERCVTGKRNVLVSGGTGTGKTSLLNALTGFVGDDERVIVIEDARELSLQSGHVVQLECRPPDERGRFGIDVRSLFKAALRMRPDRIVVGEIRDGAALDLVQAMTSGHGGCMSTVHASHPRDALARLETMALMTDVELPLRALRTQIASGVDVIVQLERKRSGARVVTHIAEVCGLDEHERYHLHDLWLHEDDASCTSERKAQS